MFAAAALATTALMVAPAMGSAQQPVRAEGRIVRLADGDSLPVPGTPVVLHRIGRDLQGPVDSTLTDAAGRFRFRFPADTEAVFILTARHQGIQYFSPPVHTNPELPDTALVIAVADTSSAAPVGLESRYLVISAPESDGTRAVVELMTLRNAGTLTRVARDSISPSWAARIPAAAIGFTVNDGDLAAAIERDHDSLVVMAPIAPGETQISVQYVLPANASRVAVPFDAPAGLVAVYLEEPGARVAGDVLVRADSATTIQGRPFAVWSGALQAGSVLDLSFPDTGSRNAIALAVLVASLAAALALVAIVRVRRATPALPDRPGSPALLIDAVAALDARYAGREAEVAPEEWAAYAAERTELKARLTAALAERGAAR